MSLLFEVKTRIASLGQFFAEGLSAGTRGNSEIFFALTLRTAENEL